MPDILAAVMTAPHQPIEIRAFPRPDLPPGAALLRTERSEVCGTDVHLWHGRLSGVPYPIIPGHVSAGVIDAVRGTLTGIDGAAIREGDRAVFFDVHRTCGRCRACTVHRTPTRCSSRRVYGITDSANEGLFGGWAQAIYLEPGVAMARLPGAVSLDDYIGRMQAGQDVIWYVTADSWAAAKSSPQIESLRARGIEVLLLSDRIDEWMIGYLGEYGGKKLRSAAKGEIDADGADEATKESRKQAEEAAAPLVERLAALLGDKVGKVQVSHRLTESPSCIVLGEYDMALHMQRLLREAGHEVPASKPTLEINPANPLVQRLGSETDESRAADIAHLLLEEAQLAAGDQLADPAAFIARVNRLV